MSDKPEPLSAMNGTDAVLGMEYNGAEGHESDTVASIIAEMRDTWTDTPPSALLDFADRIEAAAKRWREENETKVGEMIAFVKREMAKSAAPGNSAALREALERIVQTCHDLEPLFTPHAIQQHAEAALAAPARNCDRFATADKARAAFEAEHSRGIVRNLYTATFDWLFARAEGGAK